MTQEYNFVVTQDLRSTIVLNDGTEVVSYGQVSYNYGYFIEIDHSTSAVDLDIQYDQYSVIEDPQ